MTDSAPIPTQATAFAGDLPPNPPRPRKPGWAFLPTSLQNSTRIARTTKGDAYFHSHTLAVVLPAGSTSYSNTPHAYGNLHVGEPTRWLGVVPISTALAGQFSCPLIHLADLQACLTSSSWSGLITTPSRARGQYLQGQDVGYSTDRQLFAQRKVVPRNTRSHVASPALEWMAHIAGASVTA